MHIEDAYAARAIRELYWPKGQDPRITAGESGAAGLGGFMALMSDSRFTELKTDLNIKSNSRILFYNTEGATDPENFRKIVNHT
jgi:diaminopropionate ammonia-lyase